MSLSLADRVRGGGLRLSSASLRKVAGSGPLRSGPDVSWLPRVRAGDNQGNVGACTMFAFASWAEVVHGVRIPDQARIDAYRRKCSNLGIGDDGLTFLWAFEQARDEGWLPGAKYLQPVSDLSALVDQPIISGYVVTPAWEQVNAAGCLPDGAPFRDLGYHATLIVAHGCLESVGKDRPLVWVENSWSLAWGWKGLCVMSEALHHEMCRELWIVR